MVRRVKVDENGDLHCRKCNSVRLRAKEDERGKSRKHLRCAACGAKQVFEESANA